MKKLLALFIITSSVTLLHADPYGRCGNAGYGQPGTDMYYQNQGQVQQYRQGQTHGYQQYGNAGLPYDYQAPQHYGNAGQQYGNPDSQSGQQYGNPGQQYGNSQQYGYQGQQYGSPQQYGNGNGNGNGSSYQGMAPLQYGNQDQKQAGSPQHSDSRMAEQLQDALRSDPSNKFSNISVSVNEGYVTLKGSVANQNDKAALEQRVRGMPGVQNVNNQVTVKN
jgi:hypothetical protein